MLIGNPVLGLRRMSLSRLFFWTALVLAGTRSIWDCHNPNVLSVSAGNCTLSFNPKIEKIIGRKT